MVEVTLIVTVGNTVRDTFCDYPPLFVTLRHFLLHFPPLLGQSAIMKACDERIAVVILTAGEVSGKGPKNFQIYTSMIWNFLRIREKGVFRIRGRLFHFQLRQESGDRVTG